MIIGRSWGIQGGDGVICFLISRKYVIDLCVGTNDTDLTQSVNFTTPTLDQQADFGYTYDSSAYGGYGPIQASYPPFQWSQQSIYEDFLSSMICCIS